MLTKLGRSVKFTFPLKLKIAFHLKASLFLIFSRHLDLICFFLIVIFSPNLAAQQRDTVFLEQNNTEVDLWPALTLLSDPKNSFSVTDVLSRSGQFKSISTPHANLGVVDGTAWVRTYIQLNREASTDWWLKLDFLLIDEIDVYIIQEDQTKKTILQHSSFRLAQPYSRRDTTFQYPAFRLDLKKEKPYEVLIRAHKFFPVAIYFPLTIARTEKLIKDEASMQFWQSLIIGITISFVVFSLFTVILKRDLVCLWFALFAACSAVYTAAYYGLASEHLWPNSTLLRPNFVARYCLMIRAISGFLFVDAILELKLRAPKLSGALRLASCLFFIVTILFAFNLTGKAEIVWAIGALPVLITIPFAVRRATDRDSLWNWAIAGGVLYTLGVAVTTALAHGLIPWNRWTEAAEHIGALLNMATWIAVMSIRTHRRQKAAELAAVNERELVTQMAVELRHQKELAEEASFTKSRFLAAASHDLRQPIHALSLFIGALRSVPMNPKGVRLVNQIESSTDAMDRLFAALLDVSKLDAGVVEVRCQSFVLDTVLSRISDDFREIAEAKNLKFSYVRCRETVNSDPTLVERVARNLVSNAVRYTDSGRVVVGCRRRGKSIVIQVWDTGRGIAFENQNLIFGEFYQIDNPERDRDKGLGLGLAIVHRVAKLLGSEVNLRSEYGKGSCFEISLPCADTAEQAAEETMHVDTPSLTGLVVVIDDEKAIREGMSALLMAWGYRVVSSSSADEAIGLLGDHKEMPILLISDLRLRDGQNGIEAIEKLRVEYNESIPAMLITAETAAERLSEVQASRLPVLHKPVPNSKLKTAMNEILAHASMQ